MRNDKNSAPPANAGKPWDKSGDDELFALLRARKSLKQIANKMERTEEGIFARVAYHAGRLPSIEAELRRQGVILLPQYEE